MRRALDWIVVLLCVLVARAAFAADAAPPSVVLRQVGPNTWYAEGAAGLGSRANRGFISNAGVVITREGVVVVDALGSPPVARELVAAIRKITTAPIRRVIVTHYHADHIYGLQVLKDAGAEIWAHRAGQEYLGSETARLRLEQSRVDIAPAVDAGTHLVPADRWLDGDTAFEMGGLKMRVIYAGPAHTPEDLMLYVEQDGVLYAGDLVFRGRVPFVGTADSRSWLRSLERLITLGPKILVPGHGPASTTAVEDLVLTRDYLTFLRESMRRAAENLDPFDDAYRDTDWSRFSKLPLFNEANRINAYNTYLLMEREASGK